MGIWAPVRRGTGVAIPDTGSRQEGVVAYFWTIKELIRDRLLRFMFAEADDERSQVGDLLARIEVHLDREAEDVPDHPGTLAIPDTSGTMQMTRSFDELCELIRERLEDEHDVWRGPIAQGTVSAFLRRLDAARFHCGHLIKGADAADIEAHRISSRNTQVTVIDIHNLHDRAKRFVVGVVVKRMFEEKERSGNARPLTFLVLDELNKYAPREGWSPIKEVLLDIAERGRSLGIILIGAQQTASEVERRIVANSAIRVVGRLDAAEAERSEYRFLSPTARRRAAILKPGLDDAPAARDPGPAPNTLPLPRLGHPCQRGCRSGRRPVRPAAMRVLHTGDWHVGRTIQRRQRLDEAAAVLAEIVDIAMGDNVDLALVCGDIFETFAPSAEAERIVYEAFLALRNAGIPVVVAAGNHDYARRLLAVESLLAAVDVHVVAEPRRPDAGGVIEIPARGGEQVAQVAVLPWVPERLLFGAEEMMGLQPEPYQAYAEQIPRLLTALCAGFDPAKVNLLASHLFVSGARPGGGERELTIGEIFAISAAALPTSPQYIALGHVHRPQDAPGAPVPTRYAGSPLQLDFGEAGQQKSVTIVDIDPGKPARAREINLSAGRRLIDLHFALDELEAQTGADVDAYARVFVECDGPSPGLVERIQEVLPNAVEVRLVYEREAPERQVADLRAHDAGRAVCPLLPRPPRG